LDTRRRACGFVLLSISVFSVVYFNRMSPKSVRRRKYGWRLLLSILDAIDTLVSLIASLMQR
jgi:hypothetical protein